MSAERLLSQRRDLLLHPLARGAELLLRPGIPGRQVRTKDDLRTLLFAELVEYAVLVWAGESVPLLLNLALELAGSPVLFIIYQGIHTEEKS